MLPHLFLNSTPYSHIVKLMLSFYAHIEAGHKAIKPLLCNISCFQTFDPDIILYCNKLGDK
ncbi:hypothetical protein DWY31_07355 [Dorea sp. AF24-7LB]|nr:hypothetical protein DW125_08595 [Dorea sp. AM10-31]RHQ55750.1 hypothetical protein DWY31_07355 [Dorea sp. AF24-7LB]